MSDDPNITIPASSANQQLAGSARDLLKLVGAGLVTKGFIDGAYVEPLIGFLMALAPIIWSQWVIFSRNRKMLAVAAADPKNVTVK